MPGQHGYPKHSAVCLCPLVGSCNQSREEKTCVLLFRSFPYTTRVRRLTTVSAQLVSGHVVVIRLLANTFNCSCLNRKHAPPKSFFFSFFYCQELDEVHRVSLLIRDCTPLAFSKALHNFWTFGLPRVSHQYALGDPRATAFRTTGKWCLLNHASALTKLQVGGCYILLLLLIIFSLLSYHLQTARASHIAPFKRLDSFVILQTFRRLQKSLRQM